MGLQYSLYCDGQQEPSSSNEILLYNGLDLVSMDSLSIITSDNNL